MFLLLLFFGLLFPVLPTVPPFACNAAHNAVCPDGAATVRIPEGLDLRKMKTYKVVKDVVDAPRCGSGRCGGHAAGERSEVLAARGVGLRK